MDFLRRLAPQRHTDATRAVAVLPSRFSSEGPLRTPNAPAGSAPFLDEGKFVPSHEAAASQRSLLAAGPPRQAPIGGEPLHGLRLQARAEWLRPAGVPPGPLARAAVDASSTAVAAARVFGDRQTTGPLRLLPADAQPPAASPAAAPEHRAAPAPPAQARMSAPLSQAVVAQRALASRDDSAVVHVTIGRIDVVAATSPPPAARRGPKAPRPGTVTLADYLRTGHGIPR